MQHTFIYTILMVPEKQNEREERRKKNHNHDE